MNLKWTARDNSAIAMKNKNFRFFLHVDLLPFIVGSKLKKRSRKEIYFIINLLFCLWHKDKIIKYD